MRLFLCRHGQSHANRTERSQGQLDSRLTDLGNRQAKRLAAFLADEDLAAVYSSTLLRSYTTAVPVADRHGMKPTAIRQLKELDRGLGTGMQYDAITDEIEDRGIRGEDWTKTHGEDYTDLAARVLPAIEDLIERHDRDICIVAHGGVNRVYLAHIQGVTPRRAYHIDQANCCVNIIDTDAMAIDMGNYTDHLEDVRE